MKAQSKFLTIRLIALVAVTSMSPISSVFATPEAAPSGAQDVAEFITADVRADSRLRGFGITVDVSNGIAILRGESGSLNLAERAAARAMASPEIRGVVNLIEIKAASATGPSLKEQVSSALKSQSLMDAKGVKVSENNGRVTLAGTVGTPDEQELARDIVSTVSGVSAIENQLQATYEGTRSDAQIQAQITRLIEDDPLYDGLHITVVVKDGMVALHGEAGSKGELDRLIRHSYVTGVIDVEAAGVSINSDLAMEALSDKNFTPAQVSLALKDALAADSRIDGGSIQSHFHEGVVTLSGTVAHTYAREAAESTARGIPGVLRISNQIKVQSATDMARNELNP